MTYYPNNPNGQATSANSAPVVIASDQSAVSVSAASLPLPSGAATSAKQDTGNTSVASIDTKTPALGQALAAASVPVVLTAAQITTLTPPAAITNYANETGGNLAAAKTDLDTIAGAVSSSKMATKSADGDFVTLGAKADAKSTATDTTAVSIMSVLKQISASVQAPPSQAVTNAGTFAVQATLQAGSAIAGKFTTDQTTHGTTDLVAADITKVAGSAISQGHGTAATAIRVELPTDGTGVVGLNAGSALVGKVGIDQTTPGTTNAVVDTPVTSGGLSFTSASVGGTATSIKSSAGQLYGYHLFNTTAAVAYVQIFNKATGSVTLGTTAPDLSIGIPASGGVTVNFDKGIAFGTAISFACTTTRTGSTGATCDVNFYYK